MTPQEFIEKNIGCASYEVARLRILELYPVLKFKPFPETLLNKAARDLQAFEDRQNTRLAKSYPLKGDAVIRKDGRKTFIALFVGDGEFQDTNGGSFYLGENYTDYSGGFTMDVLKVADLRQTDELTELKCWLFSNNYAGANRGVHHSIKVKTWREI